MNKELGRKQSFNSGHLRDFQSDNEGEAQASKIWLAPKGNSGANNAQFDVISQRVDGTIFSDQEQGNKALKGTGLKSHVNATKNMGRIVSESDSDYSRGVSNKKKPGKYGGMSNKANA